METLLLGFAILIGGGLLSLIGVAQRNAVERARRDECRVGA